MTAIIVNAFVILALSGGQAQTVTLTSSEIVQFDLGKMEGALLRQLAWSPDDTELYLQTYDADGQGLPHEFFHYLVPTSGGDPHLVEAAPAWAANYWTWKSSQVAPGYPDFKIEVETEKDMSSTMPMRIDRLSDTTTGDATTGTGLLDLLDGAGTWQNDTVYRLRLEGEIVGEFVNQPLIPGLTFGWGPPGSGLIAYAERESGTLVIMDQSGGTQTIDGTKDVVLPGWTADGRRLAYLEGRGRDRFAVIVATVSRRSP